MILGQRYKIMFNNQCLMINSLHPPIPSLMRAYRLCPPLAQACSLCPIQNSQFSPRPTCPICPTRLTIQNSKCATPFGKLSEFVKVFSVNPASASLQLVPNSKLKIQNSQFIICQFPSHYLEYIIDLKNAYIYGR